MILVTGATGLLGSNLLFFLTSKNEKLKAVYRNDKSKALVFSLFKKLNPVSYEEQFSLIDWEKGDLLDVVFIEDLIQNVNQVYHCAAFVSFDRKDFSKLFKLNREVTYNIVNACLSKSNVKLLHVSSTAAVGKKWVQDHYEVIETNKWIQPGDNEPYASSKYSAEKEVWRGINEGLNAVIINPSVIFGPGVWTRSSMTIFAKINKGLRFYTSGANAFVDVRDVVKRMFLLMNSKTSNERFLCTGNNISFQKLFQEIAKALGKKEPKYKAPKFLLEFLWRFAILLRIIGISTPITKKSLNSAETVTKYDSSKLNKIYPEAFHTIEETIAYAVHNKLNEIL